MSAMETRPSEEQSGSTSARRHHETIPQTRDRSRANAVHQRPSNEMHTSCEAVGPHIW